MRLWGGRFTEENDRRVADFTRSVELDRELAADDIAGSMAHVRALGRAGLLTDDEVAELIGGLEGLATSVADGSMTWDPDLEDVHLNLEAALAARIGSVGAYVTYYDESEALAREGIREKTIVSTQSPYKVPDPFTPEGEAEIQEGIDAYVSVFHADLAEFRGTTIARVATDYGEGSVMMAPEALQAGMVDELSDFETTIARVAVGEVRSRVARIPTLRASGLEPIRAGEVRPIPSLEYRNAVPTL